MNSKATTEKTTTEVALVEFAAILQAMRKALDVIQLEPPGSEIAVRALRVLRSVRTVIEEAVE